ncbi:hypothetical protein GGU11DRAFT_759311, partial [Lentinula aff. detonsa]
KYEFRRNGISALLGDPSQDQVTKRKWEMMAEINTALQIEGQSSEESDHDQDCPPNGSRPLKVSRPRYRHPVVSELMGHLDLAIGIHREHTARGSGKRLRAKHARICIRTPTTSQCVLKSNLTIPKSLNSLIIQLNQTECRNSWFMNAAMLNVPASGLGCV